MPTAAEFQRYAARMIVRWFSLLLVCLASGCNTPYAELGEGEQKIYVCGQDGDAIVTARPCGERSQNHLLLTGGGFTGGMALYVDLCDAYEVTAFGYFEVVGKPPFDYRTVSWSQLKQQKDSLRRVYNGRECRHIYTE